MGCCVPLRVERFYGNDLDSLNLVTLQLLIGSLTVRRCDWSSEPPEEKKKKVFLQQMHLL